jgi:hypothetical protein
MMAFIAEDVMERPNGRFRSFLRLFVTFSGNIISTFDDVDLAWRQGKALDHINLTLNGAHEAGRSPALSVDTRGKESPSETMELVIETETHPSPVALSHIMRSLNGTNRRFGTSMTARIVSRNGLHGDIDRSPRSTEACTE